MHFSKEEIKDQLKAFLAEEASLDEGVIQTNTKLFESGLFDSIVIVSLLAFCEERYKLEFDLTTIDQAVFDTVETIAEYVVNESSISNDG